MTLPLPIDHIGIAVSDIKKAIEFYQKNFHHKLIHQETISSDNLDVAFLETGASTIELISPLNDLSPVKKFIEKKGEGLHHLAFKTENIEADIERLCREGLQAIDKTPRIGAWGKKIAFFHPSTTAGVLLELCQKA